MLNRLNRAGGVRELLSQRVELGRREERQSLSQRRDPGLALQALEGLPVGLGKARAPLLVQNVVMTSPEHGLTPGLSARPWDGVSTNAVLPPLFITSFVDHPIPRHPTLGVLMGSSTHLIGRE